MKKLGIILSVVLVLAAVLTVCAACNTHYDLSYAAWNLGTEGAPSIERKMVEEFEKLHNVKIELKEVASGNAYEDSINAMIIRKEAPDVFMINNTNYVLNGQYGLDITSLAQADSDWANIPAALEEPAHFKSGIYAIPFAMHIQGYFINTTLLEEQGIRLPANDEYSWSWFYNVITSLKGAKNEAGDSIMGLSDEESIYKWYPSAVNKDLGYFTWDGTEYHLDGDEFVDGMNLTSSLYTGGYSFESLDAETREANFEGVEGAVDLWNRGRLAIRWGSTYEMPDMIEKSGGAFNIRFIGIPYVDGAGANARTENFVSLVPDYISIYAGTQNSELAYQFAKWMTFDPAGIAKRIELDSEKGVTNNMPVTTNESTLELYFDTFTAVDGLAKMYQRLDNAITECVKVVPGFNSVQYLASTGISVTDASGATIANANMGQFFDACRQGRLSYSDYKGQADELADKQYPNAVKSYEGKYN